MAQVRKYRDRGVRSVLLRVAGRIFLGLALAGVAVDYVAFRAKRKSGPPCRQLGDSSKTQKRPACSSEVGPLRGADDLALIEPIEHA
jgi:hypothetical protein